MKSWNPRPKSLLIIDIFFVALISTAIFYLLKSFIVECDDIIVSYKNHPGVQSFSLAQTIYFGIFWLGWQNTFTISSILSIALFNLAFINVSFSNRLVLLLYPLLFSGIYIHLWQCAVRQGLAYSVLVFAFFGFKNHSLNKEQTLAFLFISTILHWSTIFIVLLYILSNAAAKINIKRGIVRLKGASGFLLSALFVAISSFGMLSSSLINKLDAYTNVYEAYLESSYGKLFSVLVILNILLIFACRLYFSIRIEVKLINTRQFWLICNFLMLTSILVQLTLLPGTIIRITMPLLSIINIIFILSIKRMTIPKLTFLATLSIPYTIYLAANMRIS